MKILAAGDLSFYAQLICRQLKSNHRLVLVDGDLPEHKFSNHVSVYRCSCGDPLFAKLLSSHDFDVALFILRQSGRQRAGRSGSLEDLEALLASCIRNDIRRLILISSTEACGASDADEAMPAVPVSRAGILYESGERMCRLYSEQSGRVVLILRVPYIYGSNTSESPLESWIAKATRGETVSLPGSADQRCDFIHAEDAISLLIRLIEDDTSEGAQIVNACTGRPVLFSDVARMIQKQLPGCNFTFSSDPSSVPSPTNDPKARKQYYWIVLHDLEQDVMGLCASTEKDRSLRSRFGRFRPLLWSNGWWIQLIEIALGFVLMQYLMSVTADSLQFRYIDFRLLFVVLAGSVHGARSGVLAALLACVSSVLSYVSLGLDWRALIYNVDNWLPYVSYLLVGVVTGYTRDKDLSAISFAKQKTSAVEKRFAFLNDLYSQMSLLKGQYKKQLISYQDSYGKVYEVVHRLDSLVAEEIMKEAVRLLEEVFGNSAIAIYMLNSNGNYARLETCSPLLYGTLQQSVISTQYPEIYEDMIGGRLWINRGMHDRYPFYCMPLKSGDSLVAVVLAFDVPYELKSASGANQFDVLCKLIQSAYNRAVEFCTATELQTSINGTHILLCDRFMKLLSIRREMKRKGLAGYALLRIIDPGNDLPALCRRVERGIRRTDRIGQGADGSIYILLAQAQAESSRQIIDRLTTLGIRCVPAEIPAEGALKMKAPSGVA